MKKELLNDKVAVRLSASTRKKLEEIAHNRGMTGSSLARFWLEEKLRKEGGK